MSGLKKINDLALRLARPKHQTANLDDTLARKIKLSWFLIFGLFLTLIFAPIFYAEMKE